MLRKPGRLASQYALYEIQEQLNDLLKDTSSIVEVCNLVHAEQGGTDSMERMKNIIWLFQKMASQMLEDEKHIFDEIDEYIMNECEREMPSPQNENTGVIYTY